MNLHILLYLKNCKILNLDDELLNLHARKAGVLMHQKAFAKTILKYQTKARYSHTAE